MTQPVSGGLFLQSGTSYQELDEESYVHVISQDMADALSGLAVPCRTVNLLNKEDVEIIAGAIVNTPAFLLTLNFMPLGFELSGKYYVDLLNCKVFCLCLDSPIRLTGLFEDGLFERIGEFYFGVLENSHREILQSYGIEQDKIFTFPHAGPPADETAPRFRDRPINVMFSGGIGTDEPAVNIFAKLGIGDPALQSALEEACENVLGGQGDIVHCVDQILPAHGIEPAALNAMANRATVLETLDGWTRTRRRHRLFATLKDIKIDFYGVFDDAFKAAHPNSTFHDPVSYRRVIEISKTAKITVNDTINLMDSALFRYYYALADGCLMASETNPFIAREFKDGEHIIHLNNADPGNGDKINSYLAEPDKSESMIAAAQAHYTAHHTWAARMQPLIACLQT
ncbi:MAG: glycosyltransferase [Rhodospirillaceae bacterium]